MTERVYKSNEQIEEEIRRIQLPFRIEMAEAYAQANIARARMEQSLADYYRAEMKRLDEQAKKLAKKIDG